MMMLSMRNDKQNLTKYTKTQKNKRNLKTNSKYKKAFILVKF